MRSAIVGTVVLAAAAAVFGAEETEPRKFDVKVLYAGAPDAPRTKEFVQFLSGWFARAEATDVASLSSEKAKPFDVVIVDSPSPMVGEKGFEMPKVAELPRDWGRPTILMGAAGGAVLNKLHIKLDWL
jgi:hypothetical protein